MVGRTRFENIKTSIIIPTSTRGADDGYREEVVYKFGQGTMAVFQLRCLRCTD